MALVARGAWRCVVAFQLAAANRAAANAAPIEAPRQSDAGSQRRTRPFFLCCRTFKRVKYRLLKVDRDDPKVPGEEEQEVEDDFAEIVAATPLQFRQANKLWDEILPLQTIHNIAPVIKLWIERDEHIGIPGILFVISKLRSFRRSRQALSILDWLAEEKPYGEFDESLHKLHISMAFDSNLARKAEEVFHRVPSELQQKESLLGAMAFGYASMHRVESAEKIFFQLKFPTMEPYTALVKLYFRVAAHDKAASFYQSIKAAKIEPSLEIYAALIREKTNMEPVEGLEEDAIAALKHAGAYEENLEIKASVANSAMVVFGYLGKAAQVSRMWKHIKKKMEGSPLPTVCYLNAIDALGAAGKVAAAEKVADEMESTKNKYVELSAAMIRVYARNEMADKAEAVIEDLRDNGVWAMFRPYAELITAYLDRDQPVKAMDALKKALLVKRMVPAYAVILKMLPVFERLRDAEGAEDMVGRYKGVTDLRMYKGLLRVYLSARVKPLEEIEARLMVKKLELDDETRGLLKALRNIVG